MLTFLKQSLTNIFLIPEGLTFVLVTIIKHKKLPRLTVNQRTKIIEWWHETKCVAQIQRNFRRHFHVVHAPGVNPT